MYCNNQMQNKMSKVVFFRYLKQAINLCFCALVACFLFLLSGCGRRVSQLVQEDVATDGYCSTNVYNQYTSIGAVPQCRYENYNNQAQHEVPTCEFYAVLNFAPPLELVYLTTEFFTYEAGIERIHYEYVFLSSLLNSEYDYFIGLVNMHPTLFMKVDNVWLRQSGVWLPLSAMMIQPIYGERSFAGAIWFWDLDGFSPGTYRIANRVVVWRVPTGEDPLWSDYREDIEYGYVWAEFVVE